MRAKLCECWPEQKYKSLDGWIGDYIVPKTYFLQIDCKTLFGLSILVGSIKINYKFDYPKFFNTKNYVPPDTQAIEIKAFF